MRISDWSSEVCSSDLHVGRAEHLARRLHPSRTAFDRSVRHRGATAGGAVLPHWMGSARACAVLEPRRKLHGLSAGFPGARAELAAEPAESGVRESVRQTLTRGELRLARPHGCG